MVFRKDFWWDICITCCMYMLGIYGYGKKNGYEKYLLNQIKLWIRLWF